MTDRELLQSILAGQNAMQGDINDMKTDIANMKTDIANTQTDVRDIRLHIENVTDKNISLLAGNYCNLVQKLDKNNIVTDQQIACQIKVNYLAEDVDKIKKAG